MKHWHYDTDDNNIVWLGIDKADAGANVLSEEVLNELSECLERVTNDNPDGLIIYSRKSSGFIAGADISEFTKVTDRESALTVIQRGQDVFNQLEKVGCPTVAMINGFCLGGGMEMALACDYRIADEDKAKLGLPEVLLGIHPGFGGSVRLPPLVGAPAAMDMMLSGRALNARRAAKIGLVDYAVPSRHLEHAAVTIIKERPSKRRASKLLSLTNNKLIRPLLALYLVKQVKKRANPGHYPAPFALIDVWKDYMDNPHRMMEEEAYSVARLIVGDTAQNLVRVFFLQEQLKSFGKPDKNNHTEFKRVHVIGGGVMGGDIAAWCALRGMQVTVQDRNPEALARVTKRAYDLFKKRLKLPRLIQDAMDRLMPDMKGNGLSHADVVIEAIFEDVTVKQNLFREIEPKMKPGAILATNTSSIPLEELSTVLEKPQNLVGLHFFNPVAKMQLVEIVKGAQTSNEVAQNAAVFTRLIDRLPLPVKSAPGFLVNRVLMPYLIEAVILAEQGIPLEAIDKAALDFGMPMGPIHLADTVGLDICLHVAEILSKELNITVPEKLKNLVEKKHLGVKTGQGFYTYKNKKPVLSRNSSYTPPEDLADRMIFRMLNEAQACLREQIVDEKDMLDGGIIFGTGFAPFRGGPMHYVEKRGKSVVIERFSEFEKRYGQRFKKDAGWD
ncbi:MAG: 3-hydroxyacyl-CoA dehydrogenase NAD-binding domain-containing protein [Gammaproteobacteria bacterium]|nr:3-hydroxyacyl-CoA dehydrogenase NAD-binding domain-containing protein [Gammaproteobacteria bacterium]MDH5593848.1 3-hydroxyacyl-CoA dehydrogenase NAD-binding domain-containing protein [Gammaproteobacteria bacterium]